MCWEFGGRPRFSETFRLLVMVLADCKSSSELVEFQPLMAKEAFCLSLSCYLRRAQVSADPGGVLDGLEVKPPFFLVGTLYTLLLLLVLVVVVVVVVLLLLLLTTTTCRGSTSSDLSASFIHFRPATTTMATVPAQSGVDVLGRIPAFVGTLYTLPLSAPLPPPYPRPLLARPPPPSNSYSDCYYDCFC